MGGGKHTCDYLKKPYWDLEIGIPITFCTSRRSAGGSRPLCPVQAPQFDQKLCPFKFIPFLLCIIRSRCTSSLYLIKPAVFCLI